MTKTKAKPPAKRRAAAKDIRTLSDLTPDARNANKGTERGTGLLEQSLRQYGAGRSVLTDRKGKIIAGNKTVEGAASIGIEKVRVVQTDGTELVVVQRTDLDLDSKAARELAIADNRVGQVSLDWNTDELAATARDFDIDLKSLGFSDDEWAKLTASIDPTATGEVVEDEVPTDAPKRCGKGELWQLGEHFLLCGDCREASDVARLIGKAKVNVAVTSPPYASQRKYDESSGFQPIDPDDYVEWWEAVQRNVRAYLAEDGSFFVNIKPHCEDGQRVLYVLDMVAAMVRQWGWRFVDEFCWKRPGVPGMWPNRLKNAWEPVYHFSAATQIKMRHEAVVKDWAEANPRAVTYDEGVGLKDKQSNRNASGFHTQPRKSKQFDGALPDNVVEVSGVQGEGHSAGYPVALPAFFLKAFSDPGDIAFDPFLGSGTTLVACEQLGRRCFGTEISAAYCDVILARWERLTGQTAQRAS